MPCSDVFDALQYATESLPNELYQRARQGDIWQSGLVEKEFYPEGTGFEQTVDTVNNVEPGETSAWQAIDSVDGQESGQGACAVSRTDVEWGFNQRTYGLEMNGYQGPVICKDEIPFAHIPESFLPSYINRLAQFTKRAYSFRLQEHFISLSTKYFAGDGNFYDGTTLAPTDANATGLTTQPTSAITPDILEEIAVYLNDKGVYGQTSELENPFVLFGSQGPMYSLYASAQAIAKLFRADPDRREDLRFSDMGDGASARLMKALGATSSFGNFTMLPNMLPPRYTWNGTNLVRVSAFTTTAATGKGVQSTLSAAWQAAPYEAILVPNPLVMRCQVVQPKNAGVDLPPANYMGDWQFVRGAYKWADCTDPTEKYGRHYAEFRHAIKPVFPDYGVTIFVKRCVGDPTLETCEGS